MRVATWVPSRSLMVLAGRDEPKGFGQNRPPTLRKAAQLSDYSKRAAQMFCWNGDGTCSQTVIALPSGSMAT